MDLFAEMWRFYSGIFVAQAQLDDLRRGAERLRLSAYLANEGEEDQ